ncbi:hypothetical protein LP420_11555 [Massilia sp. B-10]|nr:hypothetical protein LP420_11555 [Massilia sp. B-10]
MADDGVYRELLQRWSSKDFYNHGALQSPPDRQFFSTFGYFNPVADSNTNEGLLTLKQRAIEENVSYIETVFKLSPFTQNADFDALALKPGTGDAALDQAMASWMAALDQDAAFNQNIGAYVVERAARLGQCRRRASRCATSPTCCASSRRRWCSRRWCRPSRRPGKVR